MANSTDALIDNYLDQAKAPKAEAPAPTSPSAKPPTGQAAPKAATSRQASPADIDSLIDRHLDQQKSPDFTKQQPVEAPSTVGKVAGAVYGATLGPLVNRALEGGKQIADVLVPAPGSTRQVPSGYAGTSDAARSRMERPGVGQDLRDLAAGGLKIVSSPLAPLGEAARPGGEYIGRKAGPTGEQLRSELSRIKTEKVRLSKADPLYKQGTEQQYDAQIAKLERQIAAGPEQRIKETGQTAAEGAEMLGGLFLPGGGIIPGLGKLTPGLKAPMSLGRAAVRGPLALRPEIESATAGLAARGAEDAGLFTGQVARDPRMVELPTSGPLRPQPAGVTETLRKAEEALTGGARGTQREGTRSLLAAAEELATGKRLDLGEAGRRMAAQRGTYRPEPLHSTNPAPELSLEAQAVDDAGRTAGTVTHLPPTSAVGDGGEAVLSAEDFSRELFPQPGRGPLSPSSASSPIAVPDVRPGSGVLDHLRDESGRLDIGAYVDAAQTAATKLRKKLPQEEFVRRVRPESPVITEVERFEAGIAGKMHDTFSTPTDVAAVIRKAVGKPYQPKKWWDEVREMTPDKLNQYEADAVTAWDAGGRTPQAYAQAISQWPKALRDYVAHRDAALQGEQAARKYLGLDPIPTTPGPYLPRMTDAEARDIANAGGHLGVGHGLQTTVKGAQHERVFATQLEGEAAGIPYVDRRNALLQREINSLKLRHTAQLIKNLEEKGGLFRTQAAATAASPTGQSFAVQGLPGNKLWYTATEPERQFIVQNLSEKGGSSLIHFQNVLLRNPNLVNPAPHIIKNMGAKYMLARGPQGLPGLVRDVVEFGRNSNQKLIAEFTEDMPYSLSGHPTFTTINNAIVREPGLGKAVKGVTDLLSLVNKGSSKVIFQWGDPAMRYSLYKYYRTVKGMSRQDAANEAWVDLVRYGTRSDITDFWKRIPMNMFVPWRVGTVTSLFKQMTNHPIRTSLTIGAIDYLREMRYRQSGRWTHMPWDYAEGPIALAIESAKKGELGSLSANALVTAAFGPGGEFAAKSLEDWIHKMRTGQGVDWQQFTKIFWGLSQIGDGGKSLAAFHRDGQARHLVNLMTGLLLGERGALDYQPHRLQSALPQSAPGQQKDVRVRAAEALQEQRQAQQTKRASRHKGQTITERVGG